MNYHDQTHRQLHAAFLERWPLETVRRMALEEYNSIGNRDSFCYWLEVVTKPIGFISGRYAVMFEIFERRPGRSGPVKRNMSGDDRYNWFNRHGFTRDEAFEAVRAKVVQIIEAAGRGDLEAVERIEQFSPMVRWKIAFLYAPVNTMVAVFSPGHLRGIGQDLSLSLQSVAGLHRALAEMRPKEQDIYSFSADLWHRSGRYFSPRSRKYYIIGTKYGPLATESRYHEMVDASVISTDFGPPGLPLHDFYLNTDKDELHERLEHEECADLENATNNLFTFLNIRVGDIIAVKDSGNPKGGKAYLKILAYAVVAERSGSVYSFDEDLGHCLNVEFLKTDVGRELEQGGYGKTVSPVDNPEARENIFGEFFGTSDIQLAAAIEKETEQQERERRKRKGVLQISHKKGFRKATQPAVINHHHLSIQSELLAHLQQQHPDATVLGEENYVDIRVQINGSKEVHLYEIKPYVLVRDCIRTALGQLLDYARQEKDTESIRLIAVGPTPASAADKDFQAYVREHLRLPFEYKSWPADFVV